MKTFIFVPSGNDELDSERAIQDFVKMGKLHNIIGKSKTVDGGNLLKHAYDSNPQAQTVETSGEEIITWMFPAPEEDAEDWPYDQATKALMNRPVAVAPRMTS